MKWIDINKKKPPVGVRLLVVKHYINQEFSQETGGYAGPYFPSESFIDVDSSSLSSLHSWEKGGIVTHWMPLPKIPA